MPEQEKGKNIFQQAIDAVSTRDEKAAIEAAMKRAEELEKQIAESAQKLAASEQRATQNAQKLAAAEQRATQTAQKLAETEKKVAQLTTELSKAQTDLSTARSELINTNSRVAAAEQKMSLMSVELQKYASAEQAEKAAEASAAAARAQVKTEHTVKADETLSHLALKYYGSSGEAYWRLIYEANQLVIGDNPGRVRPGMVLKIPVLPEEMKKK